MVSHQQVRVYNRGLFFAGYYTSLGGLLLILLWLGAFKFTATEAAAIRPLLENHPFSGWAYQFISEQMISNLVGVVEILTAICILIGLKVAAFRTISIVALTVTLLTTLSFLFTTPGVFKIVEGIPITDFFILKDLLLLGGGLMVLSLNISPRR